MRARLQWMIFIVIYIALYAYVAYFLERVNFIALISGMSLLFLPLLYIQKVSVELKHIQWLGVIVRLIFLGAIPSLSDDFYRFLWDGAMNLNGINPFDQIPSNTTLSFGQKEQFLERMNSPEYYSIYPPLSQLVYTFGALGLQSLNLSIILLRLPLLAAEIGLIFLLPKLLSSLNLEVKNSAFYILNPLVIVEVIGNLHFEGLMVFFLATSIYVFLKNKWLGGAILFGLACSVKLLPLVLMPLLLVKFPLRSALKISAIIVLTFLLSWVPFYSKDALFHFVESFQLYFQTFEFNASTYYVLREIGYSIYGYNVIQTLGKVLPFISITIMLTIMWRKRSIDWTSFFTKAMFVMLVYYALASIVHPWYVILPLFLSLFTKHKAVVLWSFLILFSYSAYQVSGVKENMILVALEYLLFGGFLVYQMIRYPVVSNHT